MTRPGGFVTSPAQIEIQRGLGSRAAHLELREGGLVENDDPLARRAMLLADGIEPVLPSVAIDVRGSTFLGANQFGRSQPSFEPNTAPLAVSVA